MGESASHLIGPNLSRPIPSPSSSGTGFWQRPRRPLPPDLLRAASRRLGIVSLVCGALWIFASVGDHVALRVTHPGDPGWAEFPPSYWVTVLAALVSLALFFYTRRSNHDPQFVLDLGHAYMVAMAAALAVSMYSAPPIPNLPVFPMITWAGVMVLIFAAIVPSTPVKTLVASLLAVSMMPGGMLVARALGIWPAGSVSDVVVMGHPDYLLVGVAVVISHVMTRLGQQVAKARELGSYQLGELLGRGGMGEVYRASHRMLARPAAIKLIRADVIAAGEGESAEVAMRRFRREAEAAARLTSPHTVALYDFGVTEDHSLYLVMELLRGKDLHALVREHGPMPPARAVHVLRQVCESLDEAHAAGIVHRDIKPANIHVGRVGNKHDHVKVLDFGLVKSMAGGTIDESMATAAGMTPGTPGFMPPEVALGGVIDGRSDIYSLGCVAYFILTGRLVFEAETALQVLARHLGTAPVPPSLRVSSCIPTSLDRLVLACLEKKPEDRPQSAAALERALADVDVEPWTEAQASEWWSANGGTPALTKVVQTPVDPER